MDEKRTAVEKTEKGIIWTHAEGQRHEFLNNAGSLLIEVTSLLARYSIRRHEDYERPFDEPFEESFSAVGELLDDNIELMGLPESRSRTVKVDFHLLTKEHAAELAKSSADNKPWTVFLFFLSADSDMATESGWYVDCPLPPAQFQKLSQAFASRQIKRLRLGLKLNNAYINFDPPFGGVDWFVLPDEYTPRSGSFPRNGFIREFSLETPTVDLRQPETP